jgi:hypothetical protein
LRIIHRVSFSRNPLVAEKLTALGFKVSEAVHTVEVYEDDPLWPQVLALMEVYQHRRNQYAHFSDGEVKKAKWLFISANWVCGYPYPESVPEYREATYDLADLCHTCGVGYRQRAPYRMKREPKWGKRLITQLEWVNENFFVTPEVWEMVFQPLGIACMPVLKAKTDEKRETVVQLVLEPCAQLSLDMTGYPSQVCRDCGRTKYPASGLWKRGFPAIRSVPAGSHIVKTQEWFGESASAWHATLISHEFYATLQARKIQGLRYRPVEEP